MNDLPLFPLGLVLLPGETVPLHIFEPRYRELAARCVDGDEPFAIALEDAHGRRDVACTARITRVLRTYPDGRSNILVVGERPVLLHAVHDVRAYRTADAEPLDDVVARAGAAEEERAASLYRELAVALDSEQADAPEPGPGLSYRIAGRLELPTEVKQELLESRDEAERLRRVADLLDGLARGLAVTAEVQARAVRNGRVRTAEEIAGELGL